MWLLLLVVVLAIAGIAFWVDRKRRRAGLGDPRWSQHDQWGSGSGGGSF